MRRASLYNTFSASLLLVCNAWLSSCVSQIPLTKEKPVNNSTYQVEYLFEHEGCKVYRFMDMGHYIYFTNCEGDVTSIYNPQNEMFRLLGTKRSFSQNETFFFSHPYPALFRLISHF